MKVTSLQEALQSASLISFDSGKTLHPLDYTELKQMVEFNGDQVNEEVCLEVRGEGYTYSEILSAHRSGKMLLKAADDIQIIECFKVNVRQETIVESLIGRIRQADGDDLALYAELLLDHVSCIAVGDNMEVLLPKSALEEN